MERNVHLIPFPSLERIDSVAVNHDCVVLVLVNIRNRSTSTSSDILLRFSSDTAARCQSRCKVEMRRKTDRLIFRAIACAVFGWSPVTIMT